MGNLPRKIFNLKKGGLLAAFALVILTVGIAFQGMTHSTSLQRPRVRPISPARFATPGDIRWPRLRFR